MNKKLILFCALILIAAGVGYYFSKGPERISVTQYKVTKGEVKARNKKGSGPELRICQS
ncbi:hypothetical protein [Methyloprofundus sp.]|uniref:hypothetical protein n=1 Tax=Methyloprofundus sp. TaxID=2020875 RepID=UPI003D126B90